MRILFSHRIQSRDGQAVHIGALVSAFRAQGHQVLVVGPTAYDRADFGGQGRGLAALRRLCPAAVYELMEIAYNIAAIVRLIKAYKNIQPDVVYERYNLFFFGGLALKFLYRVPLHLEINAPLAEERAAHNGLSLKRLALLLQRFVWRRADHVYPVTRILAEYVARAGVLRNAITVNHNGVEISEYVRPPLPRFNPGEPLTLGFVGFLRRWHGIDSIIALLGDTSCDLKCRLVIGGDGPARPELEQQVSVAGLTDRVEFLGLVPRAQLAGVISGFDIALQPNAVEYASPLKIFEYMVLGRAIIAPDQPNIREILTNERTALLVEPGNLSALQHAIARLAGNPHLRDQLGNAARQELIARDYTWAGNARRIIQAFENAPALHDAETSEITSARG